jgi:hypothetical protein
MQGHIIADIKAGVPPAASHPITDSQSKAVWDLLDQCWAINPSQRPTAQQLLASLQFRHDNLNQDKATQAQRRNTEAQKVREPTLPSGLFYI